MKTLISPAERIIKRMVKKGELEVLDDKEYNEIFDKIEEEMEDYRIMDNYKAGMSRMEFDKVIFYQNKN